VINIVGQKIRFEKCDSEKIFNDEQVRVKQMNHIVEIVNVEKDTNGFNKVKKLSKTEYLNMETGEILNYKISENRGQNVAGLKDTFHKIRDLINNNFTGAANELHVTLTYKENMTDTKKLYSDFDKFWKRYKYKYGKNIEYISVVEPQGRGAWHCHVLIRHNNKDKVFIPSKEIQDLWGNGFIKIKSLDGVDNIGAYLSAYLGDIELNTDNFKEIACKTGNPHMEIKEINVDGVSKAFIKGGRCYLYPPGMNLYRKSKGIKFPEIKEMSYIEAKKIVGSAIPNYSRTIKIIDEESSRKLNTVTYEQYNIKRVDDGSSK
jgi:hypothetical protein